MSKDELLFNIINVEMVKGQNIMGCSENWYNPYYAIKQTFTYKELERMSEEELNDLVKLAETISEGLY